MTEITANQAWHVGYAAEKGARCPFADAALIAEWTKGRDQARRTARKDCRPRFRKGLARQRYSAA